MQQEIKIDTQEPIENTDDPLESFQKSTRQLEQKEQILKAILVQKQQSNKQLFDKLSEARKKLLNLQLKQYNQQTSTVDLGIYLQFNQMKKQIENQSRKIDMLNEDIRKQGLTVSTNNKQFIQIKQKLSQFEKEIEFGKKFTSTQYFRHYFELPQAFKICYQQVKLDFERKTKIKQALQTEKLKYEQKKKELTKLIQQKRNQYHELTREIHMLNL